MTMTPDTHSTGRRGRLVTLTLRRSEVGEILDALAELRDSSGEDWGELEARLSAIKREMDANAAKADAR